MFLEYKIQFWSISNKKNEQVTYIHYVQLSLVLPDPTFYLLLIPSLVSLLELFLARAVVWVVIFLALSRPVTLVIVLVIVLLHFSLCSCSLLPFPSPSLLKLSAVFLLQFFGLFRTSGVLHLVLIPEVNLQLFYLNEIFITDPTFPCVLFTTVSYLLIIGLEIFTTSRTGVMHGCHGCLCSGHEPMPRSKSPRTLLALALVLQVLTGMMNKHTN